MQRLFKTIEQAFNVKINCPMCNQQLQEEIYCSYLESSHISVWRSDNYIHIQDRSIPESKIDVKININSNDFDWTLDSKNSDITLEIIGNALNSTYIMLDKYCATCSYYLIFNSLKFDLALKKIHKIKLISEHVNIGDYQIYNDLEGKIVIYNLGEYVSHIKDADNSFSFQRNKREIENWLRTIITFS